MYDLFGADLNLSTANEKITFEYSIPKSTGKN
jgi:hypothetical protein